MIKDNRRFVRKNYGSGHGYLLDGEKVPGVTSIIGILDKPALVGWAAKESAGYAIEHWDELADLPLMERATKIEKARFTANKKAIIRGHRIHDLGERLAHGDEVEVPEEYQQPAELYARFCDDWELTTVATETPVCHTGYGYAGTFDAIVESPKLGRVMLDIKTGKGVYAETALQLAAYRYCDLMINDQPMLETDAAYVAHVTADSVDLVPLAQEPTITSTFLYLLQIYRDWTVRTDWKFRKEDTFDPPVRDVIYPDQKPADDARLAG